MEEIFAWFALAFFGFLSYRFIAANGCPSCGSPWFFLNPEKDASMECSIAFHVCRSCGHRKEKGTAAVMERFLGMMEVGVILIAKESTVIL